MFPRNPKVLVDNKILGASDVHAIVVKATLQQVDTAEITVPGPLQAPPPMFGIGANLEVKLALGDSIFTGRIVGMTPQAGLRELVIRAHGKMRLAQPATLSSVRGRPEDLPAHEGPPGRDLKGTPGDDRFPRGRRASALRSESAVRLMACIDSFSSVLSCGSAPISQPRQRSGCY